MAWRYVDPWRESRLLAQRRRKRRPYRHELFCCQPRKPGRIQRMFDVLTAWSLAMDDVRGGVREFRRLAR